MMRSSPWWYSEEWIRNASAETLAAVLCVQDRYWVHCGALCVSGSWCVVLEIHSQLCPVQTQRTEGWWEPQHWAKLVWVPLYYRSLCSSCLVFCFFVFDRCTGHKYRSIACALGMLWQSLQWDVSVIGELWCPTGILLLSFLFLHWFKCWLQQGADSCHKKGRKASLGL